MTATPQEQQLNLTIIITTSFNYNAQQDMIINELIKNYHENSHIKLCRSIAFDKLIQMGQVLQSRDRLLAYQEEEDTILGAVDINPVHYGIELIGGVMYPILKMYSLEGPQSALFTSISTNKTNIIEMPIYRGFRTNVNHNKLLGTIYFNLQPNDIIRVIFDNEQKDVLNVTVINETTRKSHQMLISNKWQELVDEIILREQNWDAEIYEQNRYKDEEFKSVIEQRIESLKRLSWWKKKDILYKSFSFLLPKHERQEMEQLIELSKSNKLLSFSP
ncbi:uncharacterized protein BX663DRAFT_527870 [Cokeromyces recurvatus]|uniref:uncharacterized protein n=1 Tax=Cokeromyces recurvatus TaxID=90255 RepID=UPI00221EEEE1|nr:uncharacterized protein BX663DRAFT_527870 [Cokeromyces recurvatus]KAI7897575.1 hypothetical protein BX663DRAFT_527870 [Cokeromyces recurvatus]